MRGTLEYERAIRTKITPVPTPRKNANITKVKKLVKSSGHCVKKPSTREIRQAKQKNSGPKSIIKACEVCGEKEQIVYRHITKPFFCKRKQKGGEACGHQRSVTIKLSKEQMKTLKVMTWTYNQYLNSVIQYFGEKY